MGTTSEIEVVPSVHPRRSTRRQLRERRDLPPAPPITDFLAASFTASARQSTMGGALCRPRHRRRCREQSRKPWRERPRCARPMWPRACPEGSLTPWLSLSHQGVGGGKFAARSAACLLHRPCSIATQIFRTIWSRSSGKCWQQIRSGSRALAWRSSVLEIVASSAVAFRCWLAESRRSSHVESRRRVGHHGGDAASVLGTVQGAALRSARACARPSGLDGACAQMIRGNYVMAVACSYHPEHTTHRWIHWSDRGALACGSIPSGRVRFARLLRFIFYDFDR